MNYSIYNEKSNLFVWLVVYKGYIHINPIFLEITGGLLSIPPKALPKIPTPFPVFPFTFSLVISTT